jgi:hypothetical protein
VTRERLTTSWCAWSFTLLCLLLQGCDAKLPDPATPGARLYTERCSSGCHRIYAPGSMKYEMWKVVMERMKREHPAKGFPPLTADEEKMLLDYLRKHSG